MLVGMKEYDQAEMLNEQVLQMEEAEKGKVDDKILQAMEEEEEKLR